MNFGTPVPLLIGIILILGALGLFFLDKFRPGYERDSDKVYAVLLLISGLFLLAHLDMELLASFQQLLMAGMLTTLLIESVRTREPRIEQMMPPRMDNRPPPRPRYDDRPPVRRGYRAELDDRMDSRGALRDRPMQPRMNPAQEAYWQDDYSNARPRQPYEEYRGPAGRLQPSPQPQGRPQGRPQGQPQGQPQNFNAGRPPQDRPPQDRPPQGGPPNNQYSDNSHYGERPPAQRPLDRQPDRPPSQNNYPQRPPEESNGNGNGQGNARPMPSASQSEASRERTSNGDRALNVRPYSEAPKLDDEYPSNNPA
ncbi:MAG: Ycf66 family protein [Cyanobacteria bacterium J06627_28]